MSTSSRKSAVSTIPYGTLGINRDQWGPGVESADRIRFDALLEKVLAELEPIALQEQLFCINFFQMDVISPTKLFFALKLTRKFSCVEQCDRVIVTGKYPP